MLRDIDLSEISDGKLYREEDMAKVGCNDCRGCSSCCHDTEGLFLDPLDVSSLMHGLNRDFSSFLDRELILDFHDNLFLPKMHMDSERNACYFLDENGRCSVHAFRPGICRLFPLGRYYEEAGEEPDFRFFLQTHECPIQNRYKVQISKWIGMENPKTYHAYIRKWHAVTKEAGSIASGLEKEDRQQFLLFLLRLMYETPYPETGFYEEFEGRIRKLRLLMKKLEG